MRSGSIRITRSCGSLSNNARRRSPESRKKPVASRERENKIAGVIAKAERTGHHEAAIAILNEAVALDPDNAEAKRLIELRRAAMAEEQRQARERAEKIAVAIARANETASHADRDRHLAARKRARPAAPGASPGARSTPGSAAGGASGEAAHRGAAAGDRGRPGQGQTDNVQSGGARDPAGAGPTRSGSRRDTRLDAGAADRARAGTGGLTPGTPPPGADHRTRRRGESFPIARRRGGRVDPRTRPRSFGSESARPARDPHRGGRARTRRSGATAVHSGRPCPHRRADREAQLRFGAVGTRRRGA